MLSKKYKPLWGRLQIRILKMRKCLPQRNYIRFLAKKQEPVDVSAVNPSFARQGFRWFGNSLGSSKCTLYLILGEHSASCNKIIFFVYQP